MKLRSGQQVGPWTLDSRLGSGGNAEVWRAVRGGSEGFAALKVIKTTKAQREPYLRFVREIGFMREHTDVPGILPLLDAHLPQSPSNDDRPWLAMPIAAGIQDALRGRPLADVVDAVAGVADTLWRLQHQFGVAHRDIKPANLYELDGEWLIGDFGLVALPEAPGITDQGRSLGPRHFMAYEMIIDPASADAHAADVFSLGKTLWVLATDQRYPPSGHQPSDTRQFGISDNTPHPHADALDRAVDRMTRLQPDERPTKEEVAADLAAWRSLASEPVAIDLSGARATLNKRLANTIAEQDLLEQRKELAYAAVRELQRLTLPLNEAIKSLSARAEIDLQTDELVSNVLKTRSGFGGTVSVEFRWMRVSRVAPLDGPRATALRMGRLLELMSDGSLRLATMVHVGIDGGWGAKHSWHSEPCTAPVGSIAATKMLQSCVDELAAALVEGVGVLVDEHAPGTSSD